MNKLIPLFFLLSCALLTACAQTRGYTPTIDPRTSSPSANANIDRDIQECQMLAEQAAGNTAAETAIGTGVGAVIGGAAGAVAGAIAGNAAMGAMIGGAAGGVSGATKQGFDSDNNYKHAYKNCMAGRGHRIIE